MEKGRQKGGPFFVQEINPLPDDRQFSFVINKGEMNESTRILLVDDQDRARKGLKALLATAQLGPSTVPALSLRPELRPRPGRLPPGDV